MLRVIALWGIALSVYAVQPVQAAPALSLEQSVQLALENDPAFRAYQSRSEALQEQAIADNALPDPKLKLGLMNFPTDTFARDQEPMTQIQIGVQQMFPAGDSIKYKSLRSRSLSQVQLHLSEDQRGKLIRNVRQAWLEWYYWHRAEKVVQQNRSLYQKLVRITGSQYSSGRQTQQDVIRAELELGLLDDRLVDIRNQIEVAQAKLVRYLGKQPEDAVPTAVFPQLPEPSRPDLTRHPMIQAAQANVSAGENNVALARQSFKPAWMLDVTYGDRDGLNNDGTQRADFVSAMVVVDMPLFTDNYQDRKVAASKYQLQSALHNLKDREQDLNQQWQAGYARWSSLGDRLARYEHELLPMARENAKAALYGYQSRGTQFNTLMRARITKLETELKALRLRTDRAQVQAQLLYLSGVSQ